MTEDKISLQNLKSVSIVFPAYNEEKNIQKAILSTHQIMSSITKDFELIIVNDCSTDATGEIAESLAKKYPEGGSSAGKIRVIHHELNKKLGQSLRTGFNAATKDIVVYIDSDNPVDPAVLKEALPKMESVDFLSGFRFNRNEPFKRIIYSWGYNLLIQILFGKTVKDINFSFKLIHRELLQKLQLNSKGSFIDAEMLVKAKDLNAKIEEMGLTYYPRTEGQSTLAAPRVIVKMLHELVIFFFIRLWKHTIRGKKAWWLD